MFDVFKKILTNQTISKAESEKVSQFLLLRWISGDQRLAPLANALNSNGNLPCDNLTLCNAIQSFLGGKVSYIKYPSSKKKDEKNEKLIECFSRYFSVSLQEAKEYYDWCLRNCPNEIKEMERLYKLESKEPKVK